MAEITARVDGKFESCKLFDIAPNAIKTNCHINYYHSIEKEKNVFTVWNLLLMIFV